MVGWGLMVRRGVWGAWGWGAAPYWGAYAGAAWGAAGAYGALGPTTARVGLGQRELGQHVSPVGQHHRRDALVRRLQRLDRQRLVGTDRALVQLADGADLGGPARHGRQCLHRQLRERDAWRDIQPDHRLGVGRARYRWQRVHRQLDLGRPGEGLQPEHGEHDEGRRRHDVERRRRGARRRHGRRQDLERRLLRHATTATVYKNTGSGWQSEQRQRLGDIRQRLVEDAAALEGEPGPLRPGEQRYNSFQSNGGASHSPGNWNTGSRSTSMSRPSGGGGRRR